MNLSRRGLFGGVAAAAVVAVAPKLPVFAVAPAGAPLLNYSVQVAIAEIHSMIAKQHAYDLERAILFGVRYAYSKTPFGDIIFKTPGNIQSNKMVRRYLEMYPNDLSR